MTPEKQEVDDLRTEVGSLRLQVTDMDSRIDALSRMVDRLLDERSTPGCAARVGAPVAAPGREGVPVKNEILPGAGWAKKRRLDADWDGTCDASAVAAEVARLAVGAPPRVKTEAGQESGVEAASAAVVAAGRGVEGNVRPKAEPTEGPVYNFSAEAGDASSAGMIIGGGPLSRESSFLRELDNMSIGSHGSMGMGGGGGGSLGPLQLVDVTTDEDDSGDCGGGSRSGLDVLNESFFDIDFDAEITAMPGSEQPGQHAAGLSEPPPTQQQPSSLPSLLMSPASDGALATTAVSIDENEPSSVGTAAPPATATAAAGAAAASTEGVGAADQEAKFEELTASLDSMPAESRRKLAEGMLALAQNPALFSTLANAGAAGVSAPTAYSAEISCVGSSSATTSVAGGGGGGGGSRSAATEAPEIAMPLASAALCAFAMHYMQAKAVKEPAGAMAAAAMDQSRHTVKRTASLRS